MYILDSKKRLQPKGVHGELYIAGDGVGRVIEPAGTDGRKFVADPFVPEDRMYRTGDLARLLPDGNIEYIGRIDHQVKIQGFRIELGEIESVMLNVPDIQEAAVAPLKMQMMNITCADTLRQITKYRSVNCAKEWPGIYPDI